MKKTVLLNSEVSRMIAGMGHKDSLVIGDAGLPVPPGVEKADLAVSGGVPSFISVLKAVLSELRVEKAVLGEEIRQASPGLHAEILSVISRMEEEEQIQVEIEYIPHVQFKEQTKECAGAVRTGEFTSYANIILVSGVVF